MRLKVEIQIKDPDAFYARLAARLDGAQRADAFLTRLVLLLANQIQDQATLMDAIDVAAATDNEEQT